jgi:hypothetical protein
MVIKGEGAEMPEHAKKHVKHSRRQARRTSPRLSVSSHTLTEVSKHLGGIPPRVLEVLAQKHNIRLKNSGGLVWVSARSWGQLKCLPEVQAIQEMAKLSDLGREMTDEELRILSETRPGRLPWQ